MATYESASTRRFLQGRVDNIRANSQEALEWVKAMCEERENHTVGHCDIYATNIIDIYAKKSDQLNY